MSDPIELTLTLDIDKQLAGERLLNDEGEYVGSGPTTLEGVVLGMAARELADRAVRDSTRESYRSLKDRVGDIRDEVIREQVEPLITEALSGEVQETNAYGEPKGEPTTLRALIVKQATDALKVTTSNTSSAYRSSETTLTKFIKDEVDRALKGELKKALDGAKAEVLARVQEAGGEVIADTLKRAAGRF